MARNSFILFFILFACLNPLQAATLKSVEARQSNGKTSLYFSLSEPVPYKVFTLVNPDRVVVDFENTRLLTRLDKIHMDSRLIKKVRSGHPYPGSLRLVFEVAAKTTSKPSAWRHPKHLSQFRLDLASKLPQALQGHVKESKPQPTRPILIVLDAGHGGKDPGAHGPHRTQEKDIVLAIAKRLKRLIDNTPGMHAVLTREGDYYISLRKRLKIARKHNPDLFISIHADAFHNPHSAGASVFALSQKGATSEAARWLAEKENYSELGGVDLSHLHDANDLVRTVLIDLSQTATIGASLHVGERVLKQLDVLTDLHNSHVEQARFVVLKSPDIPSILIETGFISNPKEERNLRSPTYQARLSKAIFKGIQQYFEAYPPRRKLLAQQVVHKVKAGENLSRIAAEYHTSVSALRKANRLNSNRLYVGQTLSIPS